MHYSVHYVTICGAIVYTVSLCSYIVQCVTIYVAMQCTLCHYVATMYSVSLCSYNVQCVTIYVATQCTLCHYVATMYSVSLCGYNVQCVTMQLQCTLCHYVATMYSVSLCSYNVQCVTMQLQCTVCHYVATMYSVSLCSYNVQCVTIYVATMYTVSLYIYVATQCHYVATVHTVSLCSYSAHNVTMQLQYIYTVSLCIRYIVATVYTLSLCSCNVSLYQQQYMCHVSLCSQLHCVTMQLQCTHCYCVASYVAIYTTVYTVSLNMHNITMASQLAVQPDYLSQLATVCTVTLHLCIYSAYSITMYHACILQCMYKVSQCTTVQLYIAMLLQLVIAILHTVHSVIMYVDTMQFVTICSNSLHRDTITTLHSQLYSQLVILAISIATMQLAKCV